MIMRYLLPLLLGFAAKQLKKNNSSTTGGKTAKSQSRSRRR
jgi:hypothetical protein